jgi:hypothetical protein
MLAAIQIDRPWNIEEGPLAAPLCYFYGHASPSENEECYKRQMTRIATQLDHTLSVNPAGKYLDTY